MTRHDGTNDIFDGLHSVSDDDADFYDMFEDDDDIDFEDIDNIIMLTDENGDEVPFEFLDLIKYGGKEYVVLLPREEESEEVVILETYDDGDMEHYDSIDDEDTLMTVFEMFKEKNRDRFNFFD